MLSFKYLSFITEIHQRRVRSEPVYLNDEEGIAALERIFSPSSDSLEQKSAKIAFTHLQRVGVFLVFGIHIVISLCCSLKLYSNNTFLFQTLVHEIKAQDDGPKNRTFLKEIMRYLLKKVTEATDNNFVYNILAKPQFSCPLFRLLTTLHPNSKSLGFLAMVNVFISQIKSL